MTKSNMKMVIIINTKIMIIINKKTRINMKMMKDNLKAKM